MNDTTAYPSLETPFDAATEYGQLAFIVRSILARTATATVAIVRAVNGDGTIDIQPMVAMLDGRNQATPHGIIHNVPFLRLQGGANAFIVDPVVGDIGAAIFASHDISSVKTNKAPSNPGSRRRFDMADAMFIGGLLNTDAAQYIRIDGSGVAIEADTVTISGNLTVGSGATGTFSTGTGQTVTVTAGIITDIS